MDECGICGFDVGFTRKCNSCSVRVCETCVPSLDPCCFECRTGFPEAFPSPPRFNLKVASWAREDSDAQSSGASSSSPVPICIDDLLPRKDATSEPQSGASRNTCVLNLAEYLCNSASRCGAPHEHTDLKNLTPVVAVLKECLQQVGVGQSQSDFVIQHVKMHLDHSLDDFAKDGREKPAFCGADAYAKESWQSVNDERRSAATDGLKTLDSYGAATPEVDDKPEVKQDSLCGGRTMMISNIPCRLRHESLIRAIEDLGFGGTFEFVHLPRRFGQSDSNLGYGFIHFFETSDAEKFALAFEGYRFAGKESTKACTVKLADCQGSNGSLRRRSRNFRIAQRRS